jgi:hypothetical protein
VAVLLEQAAAKKISEMKEAHKRDLASDFHGRSLAHVVVPGAEVVVKRGGYVAHYVV